MGFPKATLTLPAVNSEPLVDCAQKQANILGLATGQCRKLSHPCASASSSRFSSSFCAFSLSASASFSSLHSGCFSQCRASLCLRLLSSRSRLSLFLFSLASFFVSVGSLLC